MLYKHYAENSRKVHLPLYTIYGPNDIQNMNTEVGTYRERLDLTTMNKTGFKMDAPSSIPGTICKFV